MNNKYVSVKERAKLASFEDEKAAFEQRLKNQTNESLERLKKAGNLQETAVVFSHEGMQLFANIFGNTMERVVREAVEEKMKSVMVGMFEGIASGMTTSLSAIANEVVTNVPTQAQIQQEIEDREYLERKERQERLVEEHKARLIAEKELAEKELAEKKAAAVKEVADMKNKKNYPKQIKAWTEEEEKEFMELILDYRQKKKTDVAAFKKFAEMSGRSEKAVTNRYYYRIKEIFEAEQETLPPNQRREKRRWTKEEDELMLEEVANAIKSGKLVKEALAEFADDMGFEFKAVHGRYYSLKGNRIKYQTSSSEV